jgi:hypothetical protein
MLEVADVLRRHGNSFRARNAGHLDRSALRVMGAIEACRTAARRTKGAPIIDWRASGATRPRRPLRRLRSHRHFL